MNRQNSIRALADRERIWDTIVIGGGATGLGIAVDAATRGFSTLLFEQEDFAKGTSSRSTKLVHGGVRYLAQGDVGLVLEALKERGLLQRNAPHLVKNEAFVIPCYRWWEKPFYTIGLTLYDLMAGRLGLGKSLPKKRKTTLELIPGLRAEGLRGGVLYHDGQFELSLNSYNIPEVKINRRYMEMIRDMVTSNGTVAEKNREAIQFVKSKIDSAKWFISAIKQRHDTLMRTMQEILNFQKEYFKDGDKSKLRPMILKDIADRTGLDVSTISRVVNSKYAQTHFGIILLKSLFSEAMQTESGEIVSSYEIKNLLQTCIDEEDKRHPLTDETLMNILNAKGYCIARRTVAKYREMLDIPVARLRKQI